MKIVSPNLIPLDGLKELVSDTVHINYIVGKDIESIKTLIK